MKIFNRKEEYTEDGDALFDRISKALIPIVEEAASNGAKKREIEYLICSVAGLVCMRILSKGFGR